MFASLIIFDQRRFSSFRSLSNSAIELLVLISRPARLALARTSGFLETSEISLNSFSRILSGVFFGVKKPAQLLIDKPGMVSLIAGRVGKTAGASLLILLAL